MSKFKLGPVPSGISKGLLSFLLNVKKRIDVFGGDTNDQVITKQDLIDMNIINRSGKRLDDNGNEITE